MFQVQTFTVFMLYEFVVVVHIFKFMIMNMIKIPISIWQVELSYPIFPLIAHFIFKAELQTQVYIV